MKEFDSGVKYHSLLNLDRHEEINQGKEMNAKIKVILIPSTFKYERKPVICNFFYVKFAVKL